MGKFGMMEILLVGVIPVILFVVVYRIGKMAGRNEVYKEMSKKE